MYWYWKVRIYRGDNYAIGWVRTNRDLHEIDVIQDLYKSMTHHKMLLEGMGEQPFIGVIDLHAAFVTLWDRI
jgi:hypothetical protein